MFCYHRFCLLVVIQVLVLLMNLGNGRNQYVPNNETVVAFQLVKRKPNSGLSAYITVDRSCSSTIDNVTMVAFPALRGVRLSITYMDYEFLNLLTCDPERCLPRLFPQLYHSSFYPFLFDSEYPEDTTNIAFSDCSSVGSRSPKNHYSSPSVAQDIFVCPICAAGSDDSVLDTDLVSCAKMFQLVSLVPVIDLQWNCLGLRWSNPKCDVEKHKSSKIPRIALPATGSLVLVLLLIAFFQIYRYFKMKGDDQARLEKFLEDYSALKPTRFSYADIKRITNKLGGGAHGAIFRGKLSTEIPVTVKVLYNSDGNGKDFINEVGTIGRIHHNSVVRLLGFCADGFHRSLVYDFFPNGSLRILPRQQTEFLRWLKL